MVPSDLGHVIVVNKSLVFTLFAHGAESVMEIWHIKTRDTELMSHHVCMSRLI